MKRIFTTSIYCLLFLLLGVSFGANAHKALDKPNNELPNFVSPHLFDAFGKKLKAPLRTDENIITWSDAITKGLPVLKIGGVGMSYNDFLKKGGTDSVKIEEGGVDCIRYRISKVQDSVAIGEEFELTVTAEYIDNIPFMWQNKECGDFCIKVFMPEGFVQTGGDYRDFEGFSLRPDGLKRIERKIKGYFESKPQNNCFILTKGAKFYDPQYLLEIKQNYCFELKQEYRKSLKQIITKLQENYTELQEVSDNDKLNILGHRDYSTAVVPYNSLKAFANFDCTNKIVTIFGTLNVEQGKKIEMFWHRPDYSCSPEVPCNILKSTCNKVSAVLSGENQYFFVQGSYWNTSTNTKLSGNEHLDYRLCDSNGANCQYQCAASTAISSLLSAPPTLSPCNQTLTATCQENETVVWTFPAGIPESTTRTSVITASIGSYRAKCKNSCGDTGSESSINVTGFSQPITIQNDSHCDASIIKEVGQKVTLSIDQSYSSGTIRWLKGTQIIPNETATKLEITYTQASPTNGDEYHVEVTLPNSNCPLKGNTCVKVVPVANSCITESNVTFTLNNSSGSPYFANNNQTLAFVLDNIPPSYNTAWYRITGSNTENISTSTTDFLSKYSIDYLSANGTQIYKVELTKSGCATITKQIEVKYKDCAVIAEFWDNTTTSIYKGSNGSVVVGSNINFSATSLPNASYTWTGPNMSPLNQREGSINNISISNTGTYTVTVSNVAGCGIITATMFVNVPCFEPVTGQSYVTNSGINVGRNVMVSVGDNVGLNAPDIAGASYHWTGPNGFNKYERNPSISGYITQPMTGTYYLTVSKNGCSQPDQVTITVGCAALNNVNAYTNSPNCEVKTGETLSLWVDKGGANYTYNWTGPANFQSTWQTTGKNNVTDNYSGLYTVVVGYVGCTQTITRQVNVCIFKCDITVDTLNVVCNAASGSITSFKVKPNGNTVDRTISYKIEIKKYDSQGNPFYDQVTNYPDWVQPKLVDNGIYKFDNVPSGIYKIWVKEQKVGEVGGLGRECDGPARIVEIKCDPCSYVRIDAAPSAQFVPAPVISSITLTANYYNTQPAPINVNSLSNFIWTGPNGYSNNTQSVPVYIPGNYIVNYTANYNSAYTKACTAIKNITMPPCTAPGVIVKGYTTTCEGGVNYVQLATEGDFSNIEFSVDMVSWSTSPKLALTGPINGNYKVFARSINFRTCIFELTTITKTCDCATQPTALLSFSNDCTLSSNTLTLTGDFGPSIIEEYKIKNANGSYESAWTTNNIFTNITAGSYSVYARKQGIAACFIQSVVDVQAKQPESPVSYPCDINKSISIGETSSSIGVKTQKSWSGNALKLDGIKDFGETPPLTDLNGTAFTFETWAMPDPNASITLYGATPTANPTNQRYLVQGKANGTRAFLSVSVGDNGVNIIEETTTANSKRVIISKAINITSWTHIAVTYQTNTYTLFVNGSNQGTFSTTNAANGVDPPSVIGGSNGSFYKGKIDETRWWNNAKSETDIKANMSVALATPFAAELKRYYRYDQVSGKTIPNAVTAGTNDITLKNECNAFVDNTTVASGLELYPLFSWSNGSTGREIFITTPSVTTCYTVTMKSPTGATCSSQICIPIENCNDINVTVTPSATVQENTGVRPLLSANITNPNVLPTVSVDLETSMQMSGNDIIQIGDYRYQDNTFTYEFWAKPSTTTTEVANFNDPNASSNRHILRGGYTTDGSKASIGLTLGANGLVLFEGGPNYFSTRLRYNVTNSFANTWTHIAVVYDDGKPRLYVNGELVYSSNTQSPRRIIGIEEMGRNENTGFQGLIDELRVWNSARTSQEIKDNFDKAVVATEPCVGYWRFNRIPTGKVIDSPTKIVKDETSHQKILTLNSASVNTNNSTGTAKVNPKITWWLEKKNPTTGEITEEQVGIGSEYRMPLELIKQGTYNYTVKFVKNDNTICKKTKTITVTANTDPVTCFTIMSDQNMSLISGNTGSTLKQTLNGITNDRIWKRTYRASDNSYYVFSSFNGAVWQNNNPANNVTLVDGNPTNSNHRWRFEDLGGGRFMVRSLADENHVLYMPDGGGDQRAIVSGFPWWNWSQYAFKVQAITCPVIDEVENCVAEGRISYQRWDNIGGGTTIADLNVAINDPTKIPYDDYITSLEKQGWGADSYGTRIRGYVCPPITGYYTFWVAGDDNVELWLSTDDKVTGRQRIAYHNEWSGTREYTKFGSQQSVPIPLRKGKKYYIEVLHKEGGGGDGVSVRWQTPYTEIMEPIPGQYLAPYQACNSFTVKSTPEEEEILVDTKITMDVVKPAGVVTDKIYTWSIHQGGTAANLIDANGNSVTTIDGYTAWAKPSDEGEMIYKVVDKDDATCYQFIKKKVKSVLCACKDCGADGDAIQTVDPEVTANFSFAGQNYVVENIHLDGTPGGKVAQSISYLDGLGRPKLTVSTKSSISAGVIQDVFVPYTYDQFGRETQKNLHDFTPSQDGKLTSGASRGATLLTFEASPLNRVIRQKAPDETAEMLINYKTNVAGEIKMLTFSGGIVLVGAAYTANKLYVNETTDEKGLVSTEYKDVLGQVLCKKTGGLATYYVYDDLGNLRCVIPPKANGLLSQASFNPLAENLVFAYEYNNLGLMTKKKVPDAAIEEMVYDEYDRLRCTKLSNGQWTYVKYDAINRTIETGLCSNCTANATTRVVTVIGENYQTKTNYDTYPSDKIAYNGQNGFPSNPNTTYLKGLVTHTVTKILDPKAGMRTEVKTSPYYDDYGRVIQVASESHNNNSFTYDLKKYDFVGRVVRSRQIVKNGTDLKIDQTYSYERSGKVKSVCQKVDDGTTPVWEPVGRYYYNGLGEMEKKELGCKLQTITYAYDKRGRLKRMNNPTNLEGSKSFFGFTLAYDAVGNIEKQVWGVADRTGKDTDPFKVKKDKVYTDSYVYDPLNRIQSSTLVDDGGGTPFKLENMSYDANGNIMTLSRTFNGQAKDRMVFDYMDNSNKLKYVNESQPNLGYHPGEEFFAENSNSTGNEYDYDAAGNMTKDYNKGVGSGNYMALTYNHLNLIKTAKNSSYTYMATGQKIQAITPLGIFDYFGGTVYKNNEVEFVSSPEGRVLPKLSIKQNRSKPYVAGDTLNNFWRYEYDLKDHLGNLRVACRCTEVKDATKPEQGNPPIIVQQAHYDPWGLRLPFWGTDPNNDKYKGKPEDRFKYNGKEQQSDIGYYDYGARMYDPTMGRWFGPDPLAEKYYPLSTYAYVGNNPIRYIDPDGMDWNDPNDKKIADRLQQALSERLKVANANLKDANNRVAKLESKIAKDGSSKSLENRLDNARNDINAITATIADLNSSSSELTEMETTKLQKFTFIELSEGSQVGGTEKVNGIITMSITTNDDNAIHEASHGFQFYKGTVGKSILEREIVPYQRQYSFNPNDFSKKVPSDWGSINSREDINTNWVLGINANGIYIYGKGLKSSDIQNIFKTIRKQ